MFLRNQQFTEDIFNKENRRLDWLWTVQCALCNATTHVIAESLKCDVLRVF